MALAQAVAGRLAPYLGPTTPRRQSADKERRIAAARVFFFLTNNHIPNATNSYLDSDNSENPGTPHAQKPRRKPLFTNHFRR